jgi:hypothetical protein
VPILLSLLLTGAKPANPNLFVSSKEQEILLEPKPVTEFLYEDGCPRVPLEQANEDTEGYIWGSGMNSGSGGESFFRFDGLEFEDMSARYMVQFRDTLRTMSVLSRRPYFITSHGIAYWDEDGFVTAPNPTGDTLKTILENRVGKVIMVGNKGIAEWHNTELKYTAVPALAKLPQKKAQLYDRKGRLWLVSTNEQNFTGSSATQDRYARIVVLHNGQIASVADIRPIEPTLSAKVAVYEDNSGIIWFSGNNQIKWFGKSVHTLQLPTIPGAIESKLIVTHNGEVYLATRTTQSIYLNSVHYSASKETCSFLQACTPVSVNHMGESKRYIDPEVRSGSGN